MVAALAVEILHLSEELAELDALIREKVTEHQHTQLLGSTPGFGPVLPAEFLGATGGDLDVFQSADRFAREPPPSRPSTRRPGPAQHCAGRQRGRRRRRQSPAQGALAVLHNTRAK
ncbi:hypothetical protein LFT45_04495 [Arthrobacter sp. FW305-BF8]|uniref:hypothetical protein n=1 Tax=Arthrobacter sp. FW305-BF8 TaxID=2879617 RepID=UPI001F2BD7E2|nr:hypothetical protein [Arthrobacter sp. FW305-BF8]UKA55198.1 hypothetical protein LFT45_04495 [Arthrobacter sp. FW305-BF8]